MTQDLPPTMPPSAAPLSGRPGSFIELIHRFAWPCCAALLWVYMVLINVPWLAELPRAELDFAWGWALQWARLSGADFGQDIAFTYGPWGFVTQGYHPQTHAISMLIGVLISSVTFFALFRLTTQLIRRRWICGLLMFLLITLGGGRSMGHWEVRLLMLPWSILLIHFYVARRSRRRWDLPALCAALALVSQIKFTLLLVSLVVLSTITIDQVLRRKIPVEILVYGIAYLIFWELSGQKLASLWPYLQHSWWIAGGYAQGAAMYAATEARDITLFLLVAIAIAVMVAKSRWTTVPREVVSSLALFGAVAALLLLLFKSGFVRHDEHELIAEAGTGVLSVMIAIGIWPAVSHLAWRIGIGVVVAGALALMWASEQRWMSSGLPGTMLSTLAQVPQRAGAAAGSLLGRDPNVALYTAYVSAARDLRRIPGLEGTADAYSYTQISVISSDHAYRPRPLIQSYLAYTSALGRLDADFLRSARAPDSILFGIQTIDDHFASEEDAASWPELLTRYDLADGTCSHLLLKHAEAPRECRLVPLLAQQMKMEDSLLVPESDRPIWARITLHQTVRGMLRQTLYKNPPVLLRLRRRDGIVRGYRLLPDVAAGGFLLSPVIADPSQFMMLYATGAMEQLRGETVAELQVGGENPGSLDASYDPQYGVELFKLEYPPQDLSAVPGVSAYLRLRSTLRSATVVHSDVPLGIYAMDEGGQAIVAAYRSQVILPVPAGAHDLQIPLGIVRIAYSGGQRCDGSQMNIYAIRREPGGRFAGQLLFSRKLDPQHVPADRGPQIAVANLPVAAIDGILLETIPMDAGVNAYSYWGQPVFTVAATTLP